eukprot:6367862-Prorocentrum_lima.AAC.1
MVSSGWSSVRLRARGGLSGVLVVVSLIGALRGGLRILRLADMVGDMVGLGGAAPCVVVGLGFGA